MSTDPRFARLHTDPRFIRPKASKNKVVVDERFKHLFTQDGAGSKKKKGKTPVDKYGRSVQESKDEDELKRFYRIASPDNTGEVDEDEDEGDSESEDSGEEEQGKAESGSESESEAQDGEEDESSDEDEEEGGDEKPFVDFARGEGGLVSSDEEEEGSEDGDSSDSEGSVTLGPSILRNRREERSPSIDLSETEAPKFGSEDDDEEDNEEDEEEDAEATTRIAVVNMDWDHLRAVDLYRVLASALSATAPPPSAKASRTIPTDIDDDYKPSSKLSLAQGRLLNLRIYPSSFGKERLEREAREGPPTEVFKAAMEAEREEMEGDDVMVLKRGKNKKKEKRGKNGKRAMDSDEEEESEEEMTEKDLVRQQLEDGSEDYDGEALRRYQLERLRYYYAIATFDSAASAQHVLQEINGTEFERTANIFDLQFVPEHTSFEDDTVHDEATEASIAAAGPSYEGVEFVTDALRHSKVKLTWDADDPHRKNKITSFLASATDKKGKKAMNEDDIRVYLASSSEEEDDEEAEEEDDFFEPIPEALSASGKKTAGAGNSKRRDELRSLFGLDVKGGIEEQDWDGSSKKKGGAKGATKGAKGVEGEMQITFAPALSEGGDGKKSKGGREDDDRPETAIETYRRKEKERRERKRLERQAKKDGKPLPGLGPEDGGEDVGPGGFDDDFFNDDGAEDAFAAFDRGEDLDDGSSKKKKGAKLSKKEKREMREAEEAEGKKGRDELSLLVADEDDEMGEGGKHFDMRQILKAEKMKGKRVRKRKGKKTEESVEAPVVDNFNIDLKDDRFKSLHEDFDFAIDPTNPRFQKTRNMTALLAEGRKRRSKKHDVRAPVSGSGDVSGLKASTASVDHGADSLKQLVESVKRKAGDVGGRGKRTKV
ncbi:hypothetical protein T439DRAFT_329491 [Meredithblackwellia eburnea MCA 4105]